MPKHKPLNHSPDWEDRITKALAALALDPSLPIRKAAAAQHIPDTTLGYRLKKGGQNPRLAHAQKCILSPLQEQVLVKWVLHQDDMGIPPRQELVKAKADAIFQVTNPGERVGVNWIRRFIKRHKELETRFDRRLERQRKAAEDPSIMEHHFKLFNRAQTKYKIRPEHIWNMDEKGFLLGMAAKSKVVCRKGRRNPRFVHDGNRKLITVVEALSTTGIVLPPLVITKGSYHIAGHHINGSGGPGWRYAKSPNGWTSNELGLDWLKEMFHPLTEPK